MIPTNWPISCTLSGVSMALIVSTLDTRDMTPSLPTPKPRYSVYVHLKNYFSSLHFSPISASFCRTFSRAFRWSAKSYFVIASMPSIYPRTVSKAFNRSDIFSWKISGLLQTPKGNVWFSYFPNIITIS